MKCFYSYRLLLQEINFKVSCTFVQRASFHLYTDKTTVGFALKPICKWKESINKSLNLVSRANITLSLAY